MKKLEFKLQINAPLEKVWKVLWEDATYRKWTAAFHEGSHAVSDWEEGSRIEFLGPDGSGMFSIIEKKIPNEVMIFKHLGELKEGKEVETNWGEVREEYYLEEKNDGTELKVLLDSVGEFEEYFSTTFPIAVEVVKQLSEN